MPHSLYTLLNASELAALESQVEAACRAWILAWLGTDAAMTVRCFRAAESDALVLAENADWMALGIDSGRWIAMPASAALHAPLAAMLMPAAQGSASGAKSSTLLDALVRRALADLLLALAGDGAQSMPDTSAPGLRFLAPGSGAAVAEIACGDYRIPLFISPPQVVSMLAGAVAPIRRKIAFANRREALANGCLALTVAIGETQLELGLLQTIVAGDVIKLNTRIDQPLVVMTADGIHFCNAFLGSRDGHKSVQLTSQSTSRE